MPELPDLDKLLERNPQIDRGRVEEIQEALRRLRERGVNRKGYDLSMPGGGRRATTRSDVRVAPRLLRSHQPLGED